MDIKDALSLECAKGLNYISIPEIVEINRQITEPGSINRTQEYPEGYEQKLQNFIGNISKMNDEYSDGHEEDYFQVNNLSPIQNLVNTEYDWICRKNNNVIYMSAILMHRITAGHAFMEGNKRTAYVAASIYLANYQAHGLGLNEGYIPDLDKDLLDSLEDIAVDETSLTPKQLSKVYYKGLKKGIKESIRAQSS